MTKRFAMVVLFLILTSRGLSGQSVARGYVFAGTGDRFTATTFNSAGFGYEYVYKSGLGAGIEVGGFRSGVVPTPRQGCHMVNTAVLDNAGNGCGGSTFLAFSALYSRNVSTRFSLFATTGATVTLELLDIPSGDECDWECSRPTTGNIAFHFGGGANSRFVSFGNVERNWEFGLRTEYRGLLLNHCGGCTVNTLRIGLYVSNRR
jgi:hypothetical protein